MYFLDTTYEKNHHITFANAEYRKSVVQNVSYDVSLSMPKGEFYSGKIEINIDLNKIPTKPLYLDFRGLLISNFKINSQEVKQDS
jgi:hypothetical protein